MSNILNVVRALIAPADETYVDSHPGAFGKPALDSGCILGIETSFSVTRGDTFPDQKAESGGAETKAVLKCATHPE